MKTVIIILFVSMFYYPGTGPVLDSKEAKAAYHYLNKIRVNPKSYAAKMPFLKDVKPSTVLQWNDTLAKVAEHKAFDMANRNYFAHVDPDGFGMNYYINNAGYRLKPEFLKSRQSNYFESCNAGGLTGEEAIRMLLIDEGVPDVAHRKHLLGMDSWSSSLYDIGIGYARRDSGSNYKTYTCILIAKHQ